MQSLRQSTVLQSPQPDAVTPFAFAVWVGTIGGSALSTDPDPNVTPPAAGRILTLTPKRRGTMALGQAVLRILCGVVAGSSISTQIWIFDRTQNIWVQLGGVLVITPTGAATNTNFGTTVGNRIGMQVFVQIVANTLVQAVGYDCV